MRSAAVSEKGYRMGALSQHPAPPTVTAPPWSIAATYQTHRTHDQHGAETAMTKRRTMG